ncbi:MAG: pyruvate ferredoxin oxidoreductase [Thermoproteales archaeon]|nr:pyruvate ferredoxin oxidoreductase [Thermoproteales archaeon]
MSETVALKGKIVGMNGDEAVAFAVKQANVDVIAAYPITPQTIIVERISEYVNNGELDSAFIPVESEHSALSTVLGAALTGARVFTATASQGLALMHEILHIASSMRTPIVMAVVNRALSAPINIHCDHSDVMNARDTGWIQYFAENVQDAYDLTLQAFKVAEDLDVLLPVEVNLDGFILSHSVERLEILDDETVAKFIPPRKAVYTLDFNNPVAHGPLALTDYYMEFKRQQEEAMEAAKGKVDEVAREYEKISGRLFTKLNTFGLEDAEVAVVVMGSTTGTMKYIARKLRKEGKKVGVIGVRLFRPFPDKEILKAVENVKVLIVMDRAVSFGAVGGPLFMETAATLYGTDVTPLMMNVIYGLGGRDLTPRDAEMIFRRGLKILETGRVEEKKIWVGVRE